jgi:hypothetical protein
MTRQSMSTTDSVFLALEDPTNLMMITGVMVLGAPLDRARLWATIERRLLPFDRFRQRAVASHWRRGTLYWEDDPGFDLDHHLQPLSCQRQVIRRPCKRLSAAWRARRSICRVPYGNSTWSKRLARAVPSSEGCTTALPTGWA